MLKQLQKSYNIYQKLKFELGFDLTEKLKHISYESKYDLGTIGITFKILREYFNITDTEIIIKIKEYITAEACEKLHSYDKVLMFELGCFSCR